MIGVVASLAVALAAWSFVFVPSRRGIWVRTRVSAAAMVVTSVAVLSADDRLGEVIGRIDADALLIGVVAGSVWLVVTQLGVRVISIVVPSIVERAGELYEIAAGDRRRDIAIAIVSMAVAEELLFRGVVQSEWGLGAAVVAYTAVQVVERNWALVLAGLACGVVFGVLAQWTDGLVAPVVAHLIWTSALTFVWPLRDAGGAPVPAAREVVARGR